MERWRKLAAEVMERFPPQFFMALFLLAVYRAIQSPDETPIVDWIEGRIGITKEVWEWLFAGGAILIAYFRPAPKYTLLCSLPGAFFGGGILWYGLSFELPSTAMTYVFFTWGAVGIAIVAMVLYQEQLAANQLLAQEIASKPSEKPDAISTDTTH